MELTGLPLIGLLIGLPVAALIGVVIWSALDVEQLERDGWRCDVVHIDGCTPKRVWYKP